MVTRSCYATREQSADGVSPYDLIVGRCGEDSTEEEEESDEGTSNSFSFNVFQFSRKDGEI
ncbi:hypothetical protein ABVT39_021065 [Epinephelus coioides]